MRGGKAVGHVPARVADGGRPVERGAGGDEASGDGAQGVSAGDEVRPASALEHGALSIVRRVCHDQFVTVTPTCLAIVEGRHGGRGHRFGALCRRKASGYIAPGHPRCGAHLTERERVRVRAILQAERDVRALRMLDDTNPGDEDEREAQRYEDPDGTAWVEDLVDSSRRSA